MDFLIFFMADVLNLVNFVSVSFWIYPNITPDDMSLDELITRVSLFFFSKLDLLGLLFTRVYLFSWVYFGYFDE